MQFLPWQPLVDKETWSGSNVSLQLSVHFLSAIANELSNSFLINKICFAPNITSERFPLHNQDYYLLVWMLRSYPCPNPIFDYISCVKWSIKNIKLFRVDSILPLSPRWNRSGEWRFHVDHLGKFIQLTIAFDDNLMLGAGKLPTVVHKSGNNFSTFYFGSYNNRKKS